MCSVQAAPWPVRMCMFMQTLVLDMMPCDVQDFLLHWKTLSRHGLWALLWALLKEPSATKIWFTTLAFSDTLASTQGRLTGDLLRASLEQVIHALHGRPHMCELDQLTRQGVARFTCVASTCCAVGVLKKSQDGPLHLGKGQQSYACTGSSDTLEKLVAQADQATALWEVAVSAPDLNTTITSARAWIQALQVAVPAMKIKQDNHYIVKFVLLKILLARVANGMQVDWSKVTGSDLAMLAPDQNHNLGHFPCDMSAAEISTMLFGREDWALLASLYSCLWGDVERAFPERLDEIEQSVRDGRFATARKALREVMGCNPCACAVVESMFG